MVVICTSGNAAAGERLSIGVRGLDYSTTYVDVSAGLVMSECLNWSSGYAFRDVM